ncbi:MAG: response regulator, partial [Armatimonadetes bacterium]|nr:response regulator [Armatimonadota bacterium]
MRLSVRYKYPLVVLLPLSLLVGLLLWNELREVQERLEKQVGHTVMERTVHQAELVEAYLKEIERLTRAMAQATEIEAHDNQHILSYLEATVESNADIYGAVLAFIPHGFSPTKRLYAPYVHRTDGGLTHLDIGDMAPGVGYDYTLPEHAWFHAPATSLQLTWSEPYYDSAGGTAMISCSTPFFRKGQLWGVADVDLRLSSLREPLRDLLGSELKRVQLVSREGTLVFDDDEKRVFEVNLLEEAKASDSPEELAFARRVLSGDMGSWHLNRPSEPAYAGYAPVGDGGWALVNMVPEEEARAPEIQRLWSLAYCAAAAMVVVAGTIWLVLGRLVTPIEKLKLQMDRFARGEEILEPPISTQDEIGDLAGSFYTMSQLLLDREERIRELEGQRFRNLVANLPGAVFRCRIDGGWLAEFVSDRVLELSGYPSSDFLEDSGRSLESLMVPEDRETAVSAMRAAVEEGRPWSVEYRVRHRDGSVRWLESNGQAVYRPDGAPEFVDGILLDITARKAMEADLREARRAADAANRAKSDFLANMSHEIRTPMNAVLGLTHLALQTDLSARQRDYLQKIQGSGQALLGIINDILDFSKIEAGKLDIEEIDFRLDEVLEGVTSLFGVKANEKGLELLLFQDVEVPSDLVGDPLRLTQVVVNLVSNAIKFTDQGEILLRIQAVETDERTAVLRFSVRDSGIGMNEQQQARLFQSFSQADTSTTRKYGGTGLGLAISKRLVELMGGSIEVSSRPGQGTTFAFTARFGRGQESNRPTLPAHLDLRGSRVLVVDDNATARQILEEMLSSMEFQVDTASSGPEALERLEQGSFRIVFMDWHMPGMDGLQACREIQARYSGARPLLIMVTAYGREDVRSEAERLALDGFLLKPVSPSALLDSVMLAASEEETPATAPRRSAAPGASLTGLRVLLAEDNEINQQVARELLEQTGVSVTVANNGAEALQLLAGQSFDLVLIDVQMPEMDGYEATARIRAHPHWSELPVIAMTAHAMAGDRERCLEAGMDDHVTKPIDPDRLYAVLGHYLGGLRPPEPAPAADVVLPEIPGVDMAGALKRVGGNRKLYRRLLHDFGRDFADMPARLRQAMPGNPDEAAALAHSLAGVAGNLGMEQLRRRAREVETAAKRGDSARGLEELPGLEQELAAILPLLAVPDGPLEAPAPSSTLPAALDPEAAGLVRELQRLLEAADPRSEEVLSRLAPLVLGRGHDDAWSRLERQVEGFDFDIGAETLREIARSIGLVNPSDASGAEGFRA